MNNDTFTGILRIEIQGQKRLNKGLQKVLQNALNDGIGAGADLRFTCRIAEDVNAALQEFNSGGKQYMLNPKAKSQFGRNSAGNAYLTTGVIDTETGKRYRLKWEGKEVPLHMQRVAVAHDEGREVKPTTVALDLTTARVWELGAKDGVPRVDSRVRHDRKRSGDLYARPERRNHNRLCQADLPKGA